MKLKWTSSNKYIIKFLISLFIIGIIIGIFIYTQQPNLVKESIINELSTLTITLKETRQNNFVYYLILFSVLSLLSLIVLGIPAILFYLFYEGVSLGFLIASFFHYKKITGLIYSSIFIIINKLIIFILLIYLLIVSLNYAKKIYRSLKNKDYKIYEYVFLHLIKILFIFILLVIFNIFIYYLGNKLLAYFLFLL